jgi:hypothetical protein
VRYLLLLVLLASTAAAQPVRDDIVDLRHKRQPDRRVVLGWTADDRFVVHVASCGVNDAGGPFCASTLEIVGPRATERIAILAPKCDPCDPYKDDFRYTISTNEAMQAIRKERAALQRLGPLRASAAVARPAVKLVQDSCQLVLKHGTQRAKFKIDDCLHAGGSNSISDAAIASIDTSPDGTLAVTVAMQLRFMEWTDARTVVLLLHRK